jgi:hypothetical protein
MGTDDCIDERRIPSNTLETLRGILISSLSRENIGNIDVPPSLGRRRKVTFQELRTVHGEWYSFWMFLSLDLFTEVKTAHGNRTLLSRGFKLLSIIILNFTRYVTTDWLTN